MTACPLPASPTLTNPDMILPYRELEVLSPNLSSLWTGSAHDFQISAGPINSNRGVITPDTPIRYGNGTRLSDIGELTEVEYAPGSQLFEYEKRLSNLSLKKKHLERSSLTHEQEELIQRVKSRNRVRHISVESMSTVRDECMEIFKNIDDDVSVDDSVFEGDDEESVVNSDGYDTAELEPQHVMYQEKDQFENKDEYASAILCRRAERELLNAKMRLNSMEGKLNLARRSSPVTKSDSVSSVCSTSTPTRLSPSSPRNELQKSRKSSARHQHHPTSNSLDVGTERSAEGRNNSRISSLTSRSMGYAITDSRLTGKNEASLSKATNENIPRRGRTFPRSFILTADKPSYHLLQSLCEDVEESDHHTERDSNQCHTESGNYKVEDPSSLSRSASLTQMKDIKFQMQDLRGKLSLLRDRAREENVKRRSLQSLRTPSPFTVAEQWRMSETNASVKETVSIGRKSQTGSSNQDNVKEMVPVTDSESTAQVESNNHINQRPTENEVEPATGGVELREVDHEGDLDDCVSVDTIYHDTIVSHEDREDAFDYEHFFLHSAMGTISQERRHSFSSEDSVETTRGYSPTSSLSSSDLDGHCRSTSTTTLSTVASFATAGETYEAEPNNKSRTSNYAVQWTQSPQAQSPNPSTKAKHTSAGTKPQSVTSSKIRTSLSTLQKGNSSRPNFFKSSRISNCIQSFSSRTNLAQTCAKKSDIQLGREHELNSETDCLKDIIALKLPTQVPADLLGKNDQDLVKQLLASMSKCTLALQESKSSYEACIWRSRLDAAKRALEGYEEE